MSEAVCRSSFADILMPPESSSSSSMCWLLPPRQPHENILCEPSLLEKEETDRPGQLEIWTSIQAQKAKEAAQQLPPPYVRQHLGRSSSLLSEKSYEFCTEGLGSETGSDAFSSSDESEFPFFAKPESDEEQDSDDEEEFEADLEVEENGGVKKSKDLATVNYHCSIGRKSPSRQFPPPLPSISRRDGPCVSMRPHRRDGRLVVEAVSVPSQNYLHAERQGGRLLLSFINTSSSPDSGITTKPSIAAAHDLTAIRQEEASEEEVVVMEEEEEEEEEVEVVERGTVVEVKVSTQPQLQSGAKFLRSTVVINKFVGATPVGNQERWAETVAEEDKHQQHVNNLHEQQREMPIVTTDHDNNHEDDSEQQSFIKKTEEPAGAASPPPLRRIPSTISTTAAAAAVAETALSATGSSNVRDYGRLPRLAAQHTVLPDNKVLFTSKRRNREELLHNMRRCSQLRRPLFIWEAYCIATSS